jgi:hypothetical protein
MQSNGKLEVTPGHEAKIDTFIQKIEKQFADHSQTKSVFGFKTQVPGERLVTINNNGDEAWNFWGVRKALDSEGRSQLDSALRQRAVEVWV